MKCTDLAERIERLSPAADASEVARLCLLLSNHSYDNLSDDQALVSAWEEMDLRVRTATDQRAATTEDLAQLDDRHLEQFGPEQIWVLLRAIKVQGQFLELYLGRGLLNEITQPDTTADSEKMMQGSIGYTDRIPLVAEGTTTQDSPSSIVSSWNSRAWRCRHLAEERAFIAAQTAFDQLNYDIKRFLSSEDTPRSLVIQLLSGLKDLINEVSAWKHAPALQKINWTWSVHHALLRDV